MCLVIKNKKETKGRIAKWDIPVLKVLKKWEWDKRLYTPYQCVAVDVPCEMVPEEAQPEIYGLVLCGGAVHAYADTRNAIRDILYDWSPQYFDGRICVARGVIPEGARYWMGVRNDIAAERMRLVELVASDIRGYRDDLPTIKEWCEGRSF